ncbi:MULTISPECIES: hypothetical protein [Helicobacter]|uniref:hypothetical protein n=1 Tax=Helicobacter TaxID=209 RepID=UPI0013151E95|nr:MULTISPECIES: hypothetical protein [Helicobacter]
MKTALVFHQNQQNLFYKHNTFDDKKVCFLDSLKGKSLHYKHGCELLIIKEKK